MSMNDMLWQLWYVDVYLGGDVIVIKNYIIVIKNLINWWHASRSST